MTEIHVGRRGLTSAGVLPPSAVQSPIASGGRSASCATPSEHLHNARWGTFVNGHPHIDMKPTFLGEEGGAIFRPNSYADVFPGTYFVWLLVGLGSEPLGVPSCASSFQTRWWASP